MSAETAEAGSRPGPVEPISYSVVIPTLGTRATINDCLESLQRQTRPPAEVFVVVPEGVAFECPEPFRASTVVLRVPVPSSSGQRNAGARAASSPVVLFVDDDMELEPQCAAELLAVWQRRGLGALSGVAATCVNEDTFPGGTVARRFMLAVAQLGHRALVARGSRLMLSGAVANVRQPAREIDVQFAVGFCVSYRRDLLDVEPFDESMTGYVLLEDMDIAARMVAHAPLVHTPAARCTHAPVTPGRGVGADGAYQRGRMGVFFRGRHRTRGTVGRLAWEWSNVADLLILLLSDLRGRTLARSAAYLRGLREARRQLRAEGSL